MKNRCYFFLILVVSSFVSCEQGRFEVYTKDRRDFHNEIDRLFLKYYFIPSPTESTTVKDAGVMTSTSLSDIDTEEVSYIEDYIDISTDDDVHGSSVSGHSGASSGRGEHTRSSTSTPAVSKVTTSPEKISIEGSGEGSGDDEDDDDDEDLGSGMGYKYSTTESSQTLKTTTLSTSVPVPFSHIDHLMCRQTLKREAHSCSALALNVRSFLNEIQILTQILLQMKPKHLNPNYSVFMPIFRVCLIGVNYPSFCDNFKTFSREVILKISNEMTEFANKRDKALAEPASGKDFTCLSTNLIGIEKCVYSRITNEQVDQMLRVIIMSTGNWNQEDCKDFQVVKQCILHSIEQCEDDITYQLKTIIFKSDVITTCHGTGSTTEAYSSTLSTTRLDDSTAGNNSTTTVPVSLNGASPEVTPGLLLAVVLSIVLSRLSLEIVVN